MKAIFAKILGILKKWFLKYYNIFLVLVILLVFSLGYLYLIGPRIQGIRIGSQASLNAKRNQANELRQYLNSLDIMSQDYLRFTADKIHTLSRLLPNEEDIPGLFVQLQTLAERNGLVLNSIAVTEIEPASGELSEEESVSDNASAVTILPEHIHELNISFVISGGDYEDLKGFFTDAERNIRLFDIVDINFGSAETGPYTINMRTYYELQ